MRILLAAAALVASPALAAERIRVAIEQNTVHFGSFNGSVTASFGVAQREPWMKSLDDLLKAVDEMVYTAKSSGRNRVCVRRPDASAEGNRKAG